MSVRAFVDEHYRHFNAGTLRRAASSLIDHIEKGGTVFATLAGAMSTAEIGRSLAKMIRAGHIAAISCTGANLEEDLFHLVARDAYVDIPSPDDLTAEDEHDLLKRKLNRVTDVCIPEEEAIPRIEHALIRLWNEAYQSEEALLPHQFLYRLLRSGELAGSYQGRYPTFLALGRSGVQPSVVRSWLGRFHAGQHLCCSMLGREIEPKYRVERYALHDAPHRFLPRPPITTGIPSVGRRHRRGFPDMRGPPASSGPPRNRCPAVVLVLSNHRRKRFVRRVFGRSTERKNHVGETWG